MSDDEFVAAFLAGAIPNASFHHRDHLRLAWCLVRQSGVAAATDTITRAIRRFATHHGHREKYHETLTRFWVRIVGHAIAARPAISDFDAFLAAFPLLLDKDLPLRHWSRAALYSPAARTKWVAPDLCALPA